MIYFSSLNYKTYIIKLTNRITIFLKDGISNIGIESFKNNNDELFISKLYLLILVFEEGGEPYYELLIQYYILKIQKKIIK